LSVRSEEEEEEAPREEPPRADVPPLVLDAERRRAPLDRELLEPPEPDAGDLVAMNDPPGRVVPQ
jgi:hypothetical protein